ncbi:ulp1 protease c-terminal catalytic domain containing expressed [Hordeum vulgare]|nr:ulp1 protease c-terminal catalytic domain containing expressed [Hordeum vulgare]
MVEKVLGLPHGTRHVVVISKHEESPHREFYKTDYDQGTGNMVPLEYLGSLEVASEELPAFLLPILERHKAKWAHDISKATLRLTKLHAKRMAEFAQDVLAATKDYAPDPTNYSSPHRAKLSVPEDKFVATNCLREFNNAYQDGSLKSKDLLYFAMPHKQHWILCCINLLYKQINIFDSDKKLKNDEVYELSNNLVTNFVTLAAHAKAFTKLDFMKFTCFNPPDCPQQKTQFWRILHIAASYYFHISTCSWVWVWQTT